MPNIYDYATTEFAQDAFIAWLCANYHSADPYKKMLSEKFITNLLGVNFPFLKVEVQTQMKKVDVFLILEDANGVKKYVIIEDKTYSEEHSNQLIKYINKLRSKGTNINDIYVVYYKCGHIVKTDADILYISKSNINKNGFANNKWQIANPPIPSEMNRIKDTKKAFPCLAGFKICELDDIQMFFNITYRGIATKCNSEIINHYIININQKWIEYHTPFIDWNLEVSPKWLQVFDDFVINYKKTHRDGLKFTVKEYNGHYYELEISQISGPIYNYNNTSWPVITFDSKNKCLLFKNYKSANSCASRFGTPTHLRNNADTFLRKELPYQFFSKPSLNKIRNISPMNVNNLSNILEYVCEQFNQVISNRNQKFIL